MKDNLITRTLLSLVFLLSGELTANEANLEYKIKAGYLYNFTKFISWPEIKSPNFNLCILGNDPFGNAIDPIEEKTAFGKSIKLIRLTDDTFIENPKTQPECHILYIGGSRNAKIAVDRIKSHSNLKETLVVGEYQNGDDAAEMINFINRDGKIKLEINLETVKLTDLKISAKLLEIADLIKGKMP